MRKPTVLVAGVAAAALAVAGCGGGGGGNTSSAPAASSTPAPASSTPSSSGGGGQTLDLSADASGQLKFDKSTLSAKAGKVTIVMKNPSSLPHAIAVKGGGVNNSGQTVTKGGTSTVTITLKPGKYEFYCPVDGHEAAGMKGTLTVK